MYFLSYNHKRFSRFWKPETTCLVIDEQLYWVIAPFDQHNLIRLPWHTIGERRPYARTGAGLDPHAEGEGVHLWQALGDAAVQVVGPLGEGQLELLWGLEVSSSCNKTGRERERKNRKRETKYNIEIAYVIPVYLICIYNM